MIGIFIALFFCLRVSEARKTVIAFEKVENCKNFKGFAMLENIALINLGREGVGFNLEIKLASNGKIPDKPKALIDASKCSSAEESDCEHFVHTTHDFCRIISDKKQFYTPIFDQITPRMLCPVKSGVYTARNATLSSKELITLIKFVPNYKNIHWRIVIKITPDKSNEVLLCASLTFGLRELR